jgi:hypothetical protein
MAKVYVTEYADIRGNAALEPATAIQNMTTTATSAQTSAFNVNTNWIRVHTDGVMSFRIGVDPTATTDSPRMTVDQTEYFKVSPGHKLAAITNT